MLLSEQGFDTSQSQKLWYFAVEGTFALGVIGSKEHQQGVQEQMLVFFVDSEERLITWNDTKHLVIDEGVVSETNFGVAIHEYRDTLCDCQKIETTAAAVTQYLAGEVVEEY